MTTTIKATECDGTIKGYLQERMGVVVSGPATSSMWGAGLAVAALLVGTFAIAKAADPSSSVKVNYRSVDGHSKSATFKTLSGAQKFAQGWIGKTPTMGRGRFRGEVEDYAVSDDGIGKITVTGADLWELFPETQEAEDAYYQAEMDAQSERVMDAAHAWSKDEKSANLAEEGYRAMVDARRDIEASGEPFIIAKPRGVADEWSGERSGHHRQAGQSKPINETQSGDVFLDEDWGPVMRVARRYTEDSPHMVRVVILTGVRCGEPMGYDLDDDREVQVDTFRHTTTGRMNRVAVSILEDG